MPRLSPALLAVAFLLPAPAQAGPTKPPLSLSAHRLQYGDRLVVHGTDCPPTGLGTGYLVDLVSKPHSPGYPGIRPDEQPDTRSDGTWDAAYDVAASWLPGRYSVEARCFDSVYPHSPYPVDHVSLRPDPAVPVTGRTVVTPSVVEPGDSVHVSLRRYEASVFLGTRFLGWVYTANVGASGDVTIPDDLAAGTYTLDIYTEPDNSKPVTHPLDRFEASITIPAPSPTAAAPSRTPSSTPSPTPTPTDSPAPTESPTTPTVTLTTVDDGGSSLVPVGAGVGGAGVVGGAAWFVLRRRRRSTSR